MLSSIRSLGLAALIAAATLAGSEQAHAYAFTSFIEFGAPSIFDTAPPPWLHDMTGGLNGHLLSDVTLSDATLRVWYAGTNGNESWSLTGDGHLLGGLLVTDDTILTTPFPLGDDALAALAADGQLHVVPLESTPNRDGVRLYQAELQGHYELAYPQPSPPPRTSTPEPSTAALFVSSLPIAAELRRRRRKV